VHSRITADESDSGDEASGKIILTARRNLDGTRLLYTLSEHRRVQNVPRKPAASLRLVEPEAALPPDGAASASTTDQIAEAITLAIVERRLMPGTKLVEQQIADVFSVSRTVVRQALNRLSRDRLVTLEPARGAFVATPSVEEARQVFEVRRLVEGGMVRRLAAVITEAQAAQLHAHLAQERQALARSDVSGRTAALPARPHRLRPQPAARRWPGGARIAVQFVLNYEEGGENCVLHGDAGSEQFLSEMFNPPPTRTAT
jgi:DNA-binding transcriptional regulator YhcF (GntR family)